MGEWKPISSAPKDGTEIILFARSHGENIILVGQWYEGHGLAGSFARDDESWIVAAGHDNAPQWTHWMSLPELPT